MKQLMVKNKYEIIEYCEPKMYTFFELPSCHTALQLKGSDVLQCYVFWNKSNCIDGSL